MLKYVTLHLAFPRYTTQPWEAWCSGFLIPQGEKHVVHESGDIVAQGRTHSRHWEMSHDAEGYPMIIKRCLNKARIPFIVSIDVISLEWWVLSVRDEILSKLKHPKRYFIREKAMVRNGRIQYQALGSHTDGPTGDNAWNLGDKGWLD